MAWNKYYIFVSNQENISEQKVLKDLGLNQYIQKEKVNLYETNKPKTLFISKHKSHFILVHPDLVLDFFHEKPSSFEKEFIKLFPNSKISVLIENSTVNAYGYSVIENGKRIRVKRGIDEEILCDIGNQLQEENDAFEDFSKNLSNEEKDEIKEDIGEEGLKGYIQFQADWCVPNLISKRHLGDYVSRVNGEEIIFTKYEK